MLPVRHLHGRPQLPSQSPLRPPVLLRLSAELRPELAPAAEVRRLLPGVQDEGDAELLRGQDGRNGREVQNGVPVSAFLTNK